MRGAGVRWLPSPTGCLIGNQHCLLIIHNRVDASFRFVGQRRLIDRPILADRRAGLDRGAIAQGLESALQIFKIVDVLALKLPIHASRIADHVGDRVVMAGDVLVPIERVVEHTVNSVGFVGELAGRVGLVPFLAPVNAQKMSLSPKFWALVGYRPVDPLVDLVPALNTRR